jgi:hypothetical protein
MHYEEIAMSFARSIAGASFVVSWALLLAGRIIGASLYGAGPGSSYLAGLENIGMLIPLAAWASLAAGLFLLAPAMFSDSKVGDVEAGM